MDLAKILQKLISFTQEEYFYKQWYQTDPLAYGTPIRSWEEFRERFPADTGIPPEPPTPVGDYLTEKAFFTGNEIEVNCFKNLRYCPAFFHQLEFIKITYVMRGSATLYFNNTSYLLTEGQFCIVSPGVEQAVFSGNDGDCVMNILLRGTTFTDAFAALLEEQNILSDYFWKMSYARYSEEVLLFTGSRDEKLEKLVLQMFREIREHKRPSNILLKSYVMIFLGEGLRRHKTDVIRLTGQEEHPYLPALILKDMKQHLKTVTLKELAAKWEMSESQINHFLKVQIGYSYTYLLSEMRMKQATEYLTKTDLSVERIMEEIGWNDLSSFYRQFKKKYAMTPYQYRTYGGRNL